MSGVDNIHAELASDTRAAVPFYDWELLALASAASAAMQRPRLSAGDTPEEQASKVQAAEVARQKNLSAFRRALTDVTNEAYNRGAEVALDRDASVSSKTRCIVLVIVVLAVIGMPIVAMLTSIAPDAFSEMMAPVTALTGTVVGYWFGSGDRRRR